MMAFPPQASNQKLALSPLKTGHSPVQKLCLSILFAVWFGAGVTGFAQDEPLGNEEHEREELGVNPYTTPSIDRIFQQLDQLKSLRFDQLKRDLPATIPGTREQKALIFGGLIADGFLIVAAERKNLVDEFGRTLLRQAQALGVGEKVTRHSASLTELGRRGDWIKVRQELISTQAEVEQAMIDLRDEKIAHLISLGGWLRGLEICAGAIATHFSPAEAKILQQPDLANYFDAELKTLPPGLVHTPLFEKLRGAVDEINIVVGKPKQGLLAVSDVQRIETEAKAANDAIRQVN
jgi:hypothetical protein